MRTLSLGGGSLAAIALVGLIAACDDPKSKLPLGPTPPSASTIEISGPDSIAPGQSAQFTAMIRLSDGTRKAATTGTSVRWRSSNTSVLRVDASGLATAQLQKTEAVLTAEVGASSSLRRSTKEVVIVPDGTYRIVGMVGEADFPTAPVADARVEVTPGPLVAITDVNGQYRLYGVPADADVRVTANGYQPFGQSLRLTAHATQNFQLTLSGPRLTLSGPFTLTIENVGACSGSPALPTDLQRRSYDAVLTQTGYVVEVTLTEPRFRLNSIGRGNRFTGRAEAAGATFTLDTFGSYYGYTGPTDYPNVAERLSNGTFLVVSGTAVTTGSAAGLSGQLSGDISNWDSGFPANPPYLGGCFSQAYRFTLTPR